MTEAQARETILATIKNFHRQQKENLEILYQLPYTKLRNEEAQTLNALRLNAPLDAGATIRQTLTEVGVRFASVEWGRIQKSLPRLDYKNINWQSLESQGRDLSERRQYEITISKEDVQHLKKYGWINIAVSAASVLAIGTLVVLLLKVKSAGLPVPVFGVITTAITTAAAIAGGYVAFKLLVPLSISGKFSSPLAVSADSAKGNAEICIASAKAENLKVLDEWVQMLFEKTVKVWEDAEKC